MVHADTAMLVIADTRGCAHAFVEVDPEAAASVLDWPLAFFNEMRKDGMARKPFACFGGDRES